MGALPQTYRGRRLRASWPYHDAAGNLLGCVARFDDGDGAKDVVPFFKPNGAGFHAGALPEPRPLFGLNWLPAARERGSAVLVVEGEKAAAALHSLGFCAVTSSGGSKAAGKSDWSPLSGCSRVYVLLDNDEPGQHYARTVCEALAALERPPECLLVELPGLPAAGDVVDWLAACLPGWDEFGPVPEAERDRLADELKAAIKANAKPPPPDWTGGDWPGPIPLDAAPLPPWPDPAATLPAPIGRFVAELSRSTETPPELASLSALAALATACRGRYWVEVSRGYREPLGLFTLTALPPGSRKTAVLNAATAPLASWERQQRATLEPAIQQATSEHATLTARVAKMRQQAATLAGPEFDAAKADIAALESTLPTIPTVPQVFTGDVTPENLATLMQQNGEAMGLLSDESGIFGIMAGRYSQGQTNLDVFLQGHAGAPVRVNRGSRPPVLMDRPVLSIGLAVQPDVLRGLTLTPEFRGRGLLARFLFAVPPSNLGRRTLDAPPLSEDYRLRWEGTVHALLNRDPATDDDGNAYAHVLTLEPAAFKRWKAFQRRIEPDMGPGGRFEHLTDWASKLPGAVARIAGILHCARHALTGPEHCPIEADDMAAAIALAEALEGHALAAFDMMGADPDIDAARVVLDWLATERRDSFTLRDCFNRHRSRFPRVDDLRPALELLEERGFVRRQQPTGPARRGRPSLAFEVHPQLWERGT